MPVSLIICCYNSAARLPETLAHLARQETASPWEVILVDNACTDDTVAVGQRCWADLGSPAPLRVVHESEAGLSYARRAGLDAAQHAYAIFCDDDNWLAPDYVQTVAEILDRHPEVALAGGDATPGFEAGATPPAWFEGLQGYYALGRQGETAGYVPEARGYLWGAGLALRVSALRALYASGFVSLLSDRQGNQLSSGGDGELCFALRLQGWRLWYDPRLQLTHVMSVGRLTWPYFLRLLWGHSVSQVGMVPYYEALGQSHHFPGPEISRSGWWRHLLHRTRSLLRFGAHWLRPWRADTPADSTQMQLIKSWARCYQLWWFGYDRYQQRFREVRRLQQPTAVSPT
jgi:glycosyltransferase involved in cell wall biosynthesis